MLVSLILTAVLNSVSGWMVRVLPLGTAEWMPHAVNLAVSFIVFTALFAAMFKWLPDARLRWRDMWFGAIVTSALFLIGKFALGFYFGMQEGKSTYGAASAFVLILLWVYYSSMILLLGAEFTQVWAKRRGRRIEPVEGAAAA
jgi:membrane protein